MSELKTITARDPDIVAAEINTIKKNVQQIMIAGALEIGGKLTEAKSMVPHGEWGKWLEEKVEYSQSTADNLMKLHREYGQGQASLFDNWTNSEAFAKMSYTQHLAMLALPFESRLAFAQENNADQMSTRELDKAVREELDRIKKQLKDTEERAEAAEASLADTQEDRARAEQAARDNDKRAKDFLADKQKAEKAAVKANEDRVRAEKSEQVALGHAKKLEEQMAKVAADKEAVEAELKRVRENPDVPDAVMQAMRLEIEAEAARKAEEKVAAELDKATRKAEEEAEARREAERKAEEAARALEAAKKSDKMSNPDVAAYNALATNMMEEYNRLEGYRLKVAASDPDAGEKLKNFQLTLLDQWGASLRS